jgi:hypothetical protein
MQKLYFHFGGTPSFEFKRLDIPTVFEDKKTANI